MVIKGMLPISRNKEVRGMLSAESVHGKGLFFFIYVSTMLVSNVELREP